MYVAGRNKRLDALIRVIMVVGCATIAGCAGAAAAAGLAGTHVGGVTLWVLCVSALVCMLVWSVTPALLAGRPATVFALIADCGIGTGLAMLDDRQVMFAGCILFALVGGYVTIHVPNSGLLLHAVFVAAFTLNAAILMAVEARVSDEVAALGAAVWMWVLVGTPLAIRRVWIDARTQAELADHDPLTGLLNRAGLEHAYRDLVASADADGLAMLVVALDLDDFKTVNDLYGHAVGDDVIIETAHLLAHHYGRASAVARCGGEEFTVLAIGSPPDLYRLAEATPTVTPGIHGPATAMSIGVVTCDFRSGSDPLRRAMAAADHAMYRAKHRGGRTIVMPGRPF